jgi:hypothetical protein
MAGPRSVRTHKRGPETGKHRVSDAYDAACGAPRGGRDLCPQAQDTRHASPSVEDKATPRGASPPSAFSNGET